MSETEVLDEDVDEVEDDEAEIDSEFDKPIELLKDVSAKLLRGDIPAKPRRIESLFSHIQSVVSDIVDNSFEKLNDALELAAEANEALAEHGEVDEKAQAYLNDFENGRAHVEDGLEIMRETFFSARNMEDLQDYEEEFKEAEVQLAEGLAKLEQAVLKAEDPTLFNVHPAVESEHLDTALGAFEAGLEALNAHMEDGQKEHLEAVLDHLEIIREQVELAHEMVELKEDEEAEKKLEAGGSETVGADALGDALGAAFE